MRSGSEESMRNLLKQGLLFHSFRTSVAFMHFIDAIDKRVIVHYCN